MLVDKIKKIGVITLLLFGFVFSVFAVAPYTFTSPQEGSSGANGDILTTDGYNSTWVEPASIPGIADWVYNSSGNLTSSTSPLTIEMSDFVATSTTATSTISGNLDILGTLNAATTTTSFKNEINVSPEGADYSTINEAIAYINSQGDASPTNGYTIVIHDGLYQENIIIPNYVRLVGVGGRRGPKIYGTSGTLVTMCDIECHIDWVDLEMNPTASSDIVIDATAGNGTTGFYRIEHSDITASTTAAITPTLVEANVGVGMYMISTTNTCVFNATSTVADQSCIHLQEDNNLFWILRTIVRATSAADNGNLSTIFDESDGYTYSEIVVLESNFTSASNTDNAAIWKVTGNISQLKTMRASTIFMDGNGSGNGYAIYMDTNNDKGEVHISDSILDIAQFGTNYRYYVGTGDELNSSSVRCVDDISDDNSGGGTIRSFNDIVHDGISKIYTVGADYGLGVYTPETLLHVGSSSPTTATGYRDAFFSGALEVDGVAYFDGGVDLAASTNLSFNSTNILADSAGTMTLSNIDALDATTETTIENAIDTLSNLTSIDIGGTTIISSRQIIADTGGGLDIEIGNASGDDFTVDTTTLVVEGDTGRVGIGTTAPNEMLHIKNTVDANIYVESSADDSANLFLDGNRSIEGNSTSNIAFRWDGNTIANIQALAGADTTNKDEGYLVFYTAPPGGGTTERMRIDRNGNVGIGTASPGYKLDVEVDNTDTDYPIADFFNTNAAGGTRVKISADGADADTVLQFVTDVDGSPQDWAMGIDGSDSDKFKIGYSYLLGSNNVMTIDTSGNVGIGTTSPAYLLDVDGDFRVTNGNVGIGTASPGAPLYPLYVEVDNTDTDYPIADFFNTNAAGGTRVKISADGADADTVLQFVTDLDGSPQSWAMGIDGSDSDKFKIGYSYLLDSNNVMTIDTSGNVGIGTTSPAYLLDVDGDFRVGEAGQSNAFFVDATNGNVGIGTASPGALLEVSSSNAVATQFYLTNTGAGGTDWRFISAANSASIGGGAFGLSQNGTYRMVIDNGGNVGIGSSSPQFLLSMEASGGGYYDQSSNTWENGPSFSWLKQDREVLSKEDALEILSQTNIERYRMIEEVEELGDGADTHIGIMLDEAHEDLATHKGGSITGYNPMDTASVAFRGVQLLSGAMNISDAPLDSSSIYISADGNVGIGSEFGISTSTPEYKLQVGGNVAAEGFVNISTREAKKDIGYFEDADYSNAVEKIKGAKVATYHYNDEDSSEPMRIGLIAEEAPEEVLSADGGGVDLYKMTSFAWAAIKVQQETIDQMQVDMDELKAEMEAYKQQIINDVHELSLQAVCESVLDWMKDKVLVVKSLFINDELCIGGTCVNESQLKALLSGSSTPAGVSGDTSADASADTEAPTLTLNGNNPAILEVDSTYSDMGVKVEDNVDHNLGYEVYRDSELYTVTLATFNYGSSTMATTTGSFLQKYITTAATVTGVICGTNSGTTTIQLEERDSADPNTAGTDILGGTGINCGSGSGTTASTTLPNTSIDAGDIINLEITDSEPTGSAPSIFWVHVYGTIND